MRKRVLHFTAATLVALPPAPPGKRVYYNDDEIKGFQIGVTDKGTKSYYVYKRIAGKPTRLSLGHFPDLKVPKARDKARAMIGKLAEGENPVAERKKAEALKLTLGDAFEEYVKIRNLRPQTARDYGQIMDTALADWQKKPIVAITKDMVVKRHAKLSLKTPAYANSTMRVLRAVLNFAAIEYEDSDGNSLLPDNPVKRLSQTRRWNRDKRRQTVIKRHELKPWFDAVLAHKAKHAPGSFDHTVADYLLLLILTGLRRSEAASLTWDDIDLIGKTLHLDDTKNGEAHELPLPEYLTELLTVRRAISTSHWVFPRDVGKGPLVEPRGPMRQIMKAAGVSFALHDLRRTFTTVAESLNVSYPSLKRLLNHKISHDVTGGYIVADVERLREPIDQIAEFMLRTAGVLPVANDENSSASPAPVTGASSRAAPLLATGPRSDRRFAPSKNE